MTISQFLPGEIELVMELASVSSRENATRILILREEIYKLRKRGFKTPSIVQILIRRLMDQIENIEEDGRAEGHCLILPAAMSSFQADGLLPTGGSAPKRDIPSQPSAEGKKRQKSGEATSLQSQDNEAGFIFPSSLSTTRSVGSTTPTTTTTTTTTLTDLEGTHLRLDAEKA